MVFSTAARLTGNDAQAEDIAQDVFFKAYENFSHLRSSPTAGGWLKTVTTNLTLNYLTRYRKRWRFLSELRRARGGRAAGAAIPLPDTLLADLDAEQRRSVIDQALQETAGSSARAAGALSLRGTLLRGNRRPAERLARQSQNRYPARPHAALLPMLESRGLAPMNELPEKSDPLEQLLDRTLRALAPAPGAAGARNRGCSTDLQRRAALPWWRRSFAHWPSAARAGFVLVCLALIGWCFWAATGRRPPSSLCTPPARCPHRGAAGCGRHGGRGGARERCWRVPFRRRGSTQDWVQAPFYMQLLFGLGAAVYRTLYLRPPMAGSNRMNTSMFRRCSRIAGGPSRLAPLALSSWPLSPEAPARHLIRRPQPDTPALRPRRRLPRRPGRIGGTISTAWA